MELHPSYQQLEQPLRFSPAAASKVRELIAEDSYQPLPEVIETTTDPGDMD